MQFTMSENKKKLIDEFQSAPIQIGDYISFKNGDKEDGGMVVSVDPLKVDTNYRSKKAEIKNVKAEDVISKGIAGIGGDPFDDNDDKVRNIAFNTESILFNLNILKGAYRAGEHYDINGVNIEELNWNPFIYLPNGEKQYYQRPFVWSTEDMQLLVESLYQNMDIGKILIRKRDFNELREMQAKGETELAFNDIVDGKQRLKALELFLGDSFKDLHGNYYSDLSNNAQRKFISNSCLSYAEMEKSTDEQVIRQFLKMNHLGRPQSKEHIEFVSGLYNSFKN